MSNANSAEDRKRVHRFRGRLCSRSFSKATFDPCFRQKKRQFNPRVKELLYFGVSQRRTAKLLKLNRKLALYVHYHNQVLT